MKPRISSEGTSALIISNIMLFIQYAVKLIPLMSYMCLRFCSLSTKMKPIIAAGINEKLIETKNTMKKGEVPFNVFLTIYGTG